MTPRTVSSPHVRASGKCAAPTHNRPEWLAEALDSVLTGDFADLEVVVSNNGRPEDTRELARVVPDARVRWIEQDQSLGMMETFSRR